MAEEWYPFFLQKRVTLDSSGNGTVQLKIGSTEKFEGEELQFIVSAGTFNITSIQDQGGKGYTDANSANPLNSANFLTALDQRTSFNRFSVPLKIVPDGSISITFGSGTASATIDVTIKGKKTAIS